MPSKPSERTPPTPEIILAGIRAALAAELRPNPDLTINEWSHQYRVRSRVSAGGPGVQAQMIRSTTTADGARHALVGRRGIRIGSRRRPQSSPTLAEFEKNRIRFPRLGATTL
jgi:hypothetical protein